MGGVGWRCRLLLLGGAAGPAALRCRTGAAAREPVSSPWRDMAFPGVLRGGSGRDLIPCKTPPGSPGSGTEGWPGGGRHICPDIGIHATDMPTSSSIRPGRLPTRRRALPGPPSNNRWPPPAPRAGRVAAPLTSGGARSARDRDLAARGAANYTHNEQRKRPRGPDSARPRATAAPRTAARPRRRRRLVLGPERGRRVEAPGAAERRVPRRGLLTTRRGVGYGVCMVCWMRSRCIHHTATNDWSATDEWEAVARSNISFRPSVHSSRRFCSLPAPSSIVYNLV